jgi:serine/threonine-protein kinase
MTKPSRWEDAERVCFEALQRAPGERTAFLRDACGGDDALRQEVESLLVHELTAAPYLETPAANIAVRALARNQVANTKIFRSTATRSLGCSALAGWAKSIGRAI